MAEKSGRKSTYQDVYADQAEKLCKLGAIDAELAEFFDITTETVKQWRKIHPKFGEACRRGKMIADAEVANCLYKNATGYKHIAFKMFCHEGKVVTKRYVEHYQPNTTAQIFWLKNRRPDLWRDRHELTGKDGKDLPATQAPDVLEVARGVLWLFTAAEQEAAGAINKAAGATA